ncbi:hypothetical protein ACFL96_00140 [Thermoproteota archaeon]
MTITIQNRQSSTAEDTAISSQKHPQDTKQNIKTQDSFSKTIYLAVKIIIITVISAALGILGVRAVMKLCVYWDTVMYHLPFAALRGNLNIPYTMPQRLQDLYNGFPPLPHLIQGLLWRITGSVNATNVINYIAFISFLAFCHIKLKAKFWITGLIALTAPMILIHTTVNYVDLFSNSLLAIGICACIYMVLFNKTKDTRLLIWAAAGFTLTAWSKFQLVPVSFLFLFLLLSYVMVSVIRPQKLQKPISRLKKLILNRHIHILILAILITAIPYLKNITKYKNPFWPVKLPVLSSLFPYTFDTDSNSDAQKPRALKHLPQPLLFLHSLFEINHPTRYEHRERWTIDQGVAVIAFRMGGYWYMAVIINLISILVFALVFDPKKGAGLIAFHLLLLAFTSCLPQSHELRYYMFLPLSWAATIGMLFPCFKQTYFKTSIAVLVLYLVLFGWMVKENTAHYKIQKETWQTAAKKWNAAPWWPYLKPNYTYCIVGMEPIGILLTGPTHSEFKIIEKKDISACPAESIIIKDHAFVK